MARNASRKRDASVAERLASHPVTNSITLLPPSGVKRRFAGTTTATRHDDPVCASGGTGNSIGTGGFPSSNGIIHAENGSVLDFYGVVVLRMT